MGAGEGTRGEAGWAISLAWLSAPLSARRQGGADGELSWLWGGGADARTGGGTKTSGGGTRRRMLCMDLDQWSILFRLIFARFIWYRWFSLFSFLFLLIFFFNLQFIQKIQASNIFLVLLQPEVSVGSDLLVCCFVLKLWNTAIHLDVRQKKKKPYEQQ